MAAATALRAAAAATPATRPMGSRRPATAASRPAGRRPRTRPVARPTTSTAPRTRLVGLRPQRRRRRRRLPRCRRAGNRRKTPIVPRPGDVQTCVAKTKISHRMSCCFTCRSPWFSSEGSLRDNKLRCLRVFLKPNVTWKQLPGPEVVRLTTSIGHLVRRGGIHRCSGGWDNVLAISAKVIPWD